MALCEGLAFFRLAEWKAGGGVSPPQCWHGSYQGCFDRGGNDLFL